MIFCGDDTTLAADDLFGGDEVEEAFALDGVELEAGVVEGGDDDGGTNVVVPDVVGVAGFELGVPEAEHAGEVVTFPIAGAVLSEVDEFVEAVGVDAVPLIQAERVPAVVFEGVDAFIDVGTFEALAGEQHQFLRFIRIAHDDGEVPVCEKAVADLAELAANDGATSFVFLHPVGDEVAFLEFVFSRIKSVRLGLVEAGERDEFGAVFIGGLQ